jgi:hypothetical protein
MEYAVIGFALFGALIASTMADQHRLLYNVLVVGVIVGIIIAGVLER